MVVVNLHVHRVYVLFTPICFQSHYLHHINSITCNFDTEYTFFPSLRFLLAQLRVDSIRDQYWKRITTRPQEQQLDREAWVALTWTYSGTSVGKEGTEDVWG